MTYRLAAVILLTLSCLVISSAACSAGPAPQPVSERELLSGEETAREAGEAAGERRNDERAVLYATSDGVEDTQREEEEEAEEAPADEDLIATVATVYVDTDGQWLDSDGALVEVDELAELAAVPLAGRAIRLVIDEEGTDIPLGEMMPLFDSLHGRHAFVEITFGEVPEALEINEEEQPDHEVEE